MSRIFNRAMRVCALVAGLMICIPPATPVAAFPYGPVPVVETVRVDTLPGVTRIVLRTNWPVKPALYLLPDPNRLVVDLPEMLWRIPHASGVVKSRLVKGYAFGLVQPGVSRLVLDLAGKSRIRGYSVVRSPDGAAHLLFIDLEDNTAVVPPPNSGAFGRSMRAQMTAPTYQAPAPAPAPVESLATAEPVFDPRTAEYAMLSDILSSRSDDELVVSEMFVDPPAPIVEPAPVTPPPVKPEGSESIEAQPDAATVAIADAIVEQSKGNDVQTLAASVSALLSAVLPSPKPDLLTERKKPVAEKLRIVLDPGHGGHDPGTGEGRAIPEDEIVLEFAHQLRTLLDASGSYEVFMTRGTDVFVKLEDRVNFARRKDADLFISIHADWYSDPRASGVTAYTITEEASIRRANEIAKDRDEIGRVAGVDLSKQSKGVAEALLDLTRRETAVRSMQFARAVIDSVEEDTPVLKNPIRRNNFRVLKAPDFPSVLLELGFVSNDEDYARLTSPEWRLTTARAVVRGIDAWRDEGSDKPESWISDAAAAELGSDR